MSALRPIEPQALGDRIYDAIRTAIIQNELEADQKLSDAQLAEALGVSRTPVRDALHRLQGVGLVTTRERSGWQVSPLQERDIREVFEVRRLLEPLGIDRLERYPDPARVQQLATFFDDYEFEIPHERYPDYFARDHAFHELLVRCSDNRKVESIYAALGNHIDRGRHFLSGRKVGRVDDTLQEHLAVCDALAQQDFARARTALLHHLSRGEELMIDHLRRREEQV